MRVKYAIQSFIMIWMIRSQKLNNVFHVWGHEWPETWKGLLGARKLLTAMPHSPPGLHVRRPHSWLVDIYPSYPSPDIYLLLVVFVFLGHPEVSIHLRTKVLNKMHRNTSLLFSGKILHLLCLVQTDTVICNYRATSDKDPLWGITLPTHLVAEWIILLWHLTCHNSWSPSVAEDTDYWIAASDLSDFCNVFLISFP